VPAAPAKVTSKRVVFIDLARALAVVFMLYGHTVSALLAPQYKTGVWFDAWTFQRGLTSSLFLLLSGFAFSIATSRHWAMHLHLSTASLKRARRFGLFILLGYALHIPVSRFAHLASAGDEQWRSFLAVDVLQLIGVTFVGVQILVLLTRSRVAFTAVSLALAAAVVLATPFMWTVDWSMRVPVWLAPYLSISTGSLFPVFPWSAFVLVGAGLGQFYARWGASHLGLYARRVLLVPGLILLAAAILGRYAAAGVAWAVVPLDVQTRIGACLIVLAVVAFASRRISHLPHLFGAVAQETLLIYFVHLCIVYGSVWNSGLAQIYGDTLAPSATVGWVLALLASMALLAVYWNAWKHTRPRVARWVTVAAGAVLLGRLL
jgi:uncharacterized membrane protein